ncbi:MFS transporter [Clostridium sp. MD294]|uniref:MFS transporter n=1 Tax=Clostridium sp. MD294 TaxID=97138 RepID=UPI0002CB6964|nr:MFS transporter [Clostridium sp. MD294]NDO45640.1 MFS transporter [Clostridium sp. MD294]USF30704.1 hypothetical protein C820_002147 [Clostridium sp. MD294]
MTQKLFSKNFILLILGQSASLFGNFIVKLSLSMHILEKTKSAAIFAGILSIATIPTILFSPLGGIIADRTNKKNIMVLLDVLTGIFILFATILLSENNDIIIITMLLLILSILTAFETPTVQSCIPSMLTGDNITKANAIVNQIASLSYFIAPMLGSILYTMFGLKNVMYISILFFFITALLECFIQLNHCTSYSNNNLFSIIKHDFLYSMQYIFKKQTSIFKILVFTAIFRFFVTGITIVGLPYIVRTILSLNAKYYGAAESALAIATILGSIASVVFAEKLKIHKLYHILCFIGLFIIIAGIAFIFPINAITKYGINIISYCGIQISVTIFSIFAVSYIQQKTPNHIIGKIMSYTSAITLCVQPIGQMVYGLFFDYFHNKIYIVMIITGIIVSTIAISSSSFFKTLK